MGDRDDSDTIWKTNPVIKRHPGNPILTADDVPYHATLVFNAGVCRYQGRYVMMFRNDFGDAEAKRLDGHNMGLASSDDGVRWQVEGRPIGDDPGHPLYRCVDPRLTVLDGKVYLTCWHGKRHPAGTGHGTCGVVATTDDFEAWDRIYTSLPDNRNFAVFPERFNGRIVMLVRPFPKYLREGDRFDIWISASPDGRYWGDNELLIRTQDVPWVNDKIGPAHPPIRTERGWFALFHGVDIDESRRNRGWEGNWKKRYSVGAMLLDLDNPCRVIGITGQPLMVPDPEVPYEAKGYRDFTIFPGGAVLEAGGELKIYYGAADTVECLATAPIDDLIDLCREPIG